MLDRRSAMTAVQWHSFLTLCEKQCCSEVVRVGGSYPLGTAPAQSDWGTYGLNVCSEWKMLWHLNSLRATCRRPAEKLSRPEVNGGSLLHVMMTHDISCKINKQFYVNVCSTGFVISELILFSHSTEKTFKVKLEFFYACFFSPICLFFCLKL